MGFTERDLVTLGFCAIKPWQSVPSFAPRQYLVCSPGFADRPPGWVDHWRHNAVWLFDSLVDVDAVVPAAEREEFLTLGLRGLPEQVGAHRDGWRLEWLARDVRPDPIPRHFVRLGYDVCGRYAQSTLESSPIACNDYAEELGANAYCLLDTFAAALAAAERFAREGVAAPGPYVVLEVWADRYPAAGPRPSSAR